MHILNRDDLRKAFSAALVGAVAIGFGGYFRSNIEIYIGKTFTTWPSWSVGILYGLLVLNVIDGWRFVRDAERQEREQEAADKYQQAEWEHEQQQQKEEWEAFTNWVKQNPLTAERLMVIVESEQIKDPEYRAWIAERREIEGPDVLTDLPRLFDWLKAQRDLKKFGLDLHLPPGSGE